MLSLNPSSMRAASGDGVANPHGGYSLSNAAAGDPAGFASLLRQTQAVAAPMHGPAPAAPAAPAGTPSAQKDASTDPSSSQTTDDAPSANESDTAQRARVLRGGKLRAADSPPASPRDAKGITAAHDARDSKGEASVEKDDTAERSEKAIVGSCSAPETALAIGATPVEPSVMHWLAGQQRADTREAGKVEPGADGETVPADGAVATTTNTNSAATAARGAAKGAVAEDPRASDARGQALAAEPVAASPFAAALAEQAVVVEKLANKTVDKLANAAAAIAGNAGSFAPTSNSGTDATAPVAVPINAPVNAPDFAQELGLRLSTLAKDGLHSAELHLNPADMGPVSVQIVMDGTQARVDFGADMAETRQAIEAGLPQLASALADAGFTLAGGGVSQHAGGRGDGGASPDASRDRRTPAASNEVRRVATAVRRVVSKGGVDLYA